jgi:short subunit fatty acids transporter
MNLLFVFSERLQQWSTRKNILIILILFILFIISLPIFYLLYPPASDMKSLDDPVIYTSAEIYEILESWEKTGRFTQMWFHVTWDLAVPILY